MPQFWWINEGNMVEFDGPFSTELEARRKAERMYRRIIKDTATVHIVMTVAQADIKLIRKVKWRNA